MPRTLCKPSRNKAHPARRHKQTCRPRATCRWAIAYAGPAHSGYCKFVFLPGALSSGWIRATAHTFCSNRVVSSPLPRSLPFLAALDVGFPDVVQLVTIEDLLIVGTS